MYLHGKRLAALAFVLNVATMGAAHAADDPAKPADDAAKPAIPNLSDVLMASGITESGYVAASYYRSNGYSTDHQFDDKHDTFQLDQAALTLAFQPKEGFGALVNVAAGEDMKILNAAEGSNANSFDIVQGFLQYATGPVTVIAGKFVTLAGAEVIAPTGNTNFSRSLLFYSEPLTHTGVRATYAVTDTLSVIAGVNNGWNHASLTNYGSKTGELGVAWTPNKIFALTAQAYVGKEQLFDSTGAFLEDGLRTFFDTVATYNATDSLSFVLSYDWGQQRQSVVGVTTEKWQGVAAYANYAVTDQWRVSVRGEYLDDEDGFITGYAQAIKEGTVTVGYSPVKSFELRVEARYDKSNQTTFVRKLVSEADSVASDYSNNQTGFAVQGVYKF